MVPLVVVIGESKHGQMDGDFGTGPSWSALGCSVVERRRVRAEFIARGLRSRDEARRTGRYADADAVVAGLQRKLDAAHARLTKSRKGVSGSG